MHPLRCPYRGNALALRASRGLHNNQLVLTWPPYRLFQDINFYLTDQKIKVLKMTLYYKTNSFGLTVFDKLWSSAQNNVFCAHSSSVRRTWLSNFLRWSYMEIKFIRSTFFLLLQEPLSWLSLLFHQMHGKSFKAQNVGQKFEEIFF